MTEILLFSMTSWQQNSLLNHKLKIFNEMQPVARWFVLMASLACSESGNQRLLTSVLL